jgi:ferric-dicitrate binding protein FerR (iron transport regulator)
VRLADGSSMRLAPATVVTMSGTHARVIGEAYFTVTSRATRPFVVHTVNATVQVLGTKFSVRQYPDDRQSRIVVDEGRVALRSVRGQPGQAASKVVSPHMVAMVTDSGMIVTSEWLPSEHSDLAHGVLVFNRAPLRDVVATLGQVYGTTVRVADSALANETIVVELDVHEKTLTQALDVISYTMHAHYVRRDSAFVVLPGHTRSATPREPMQRTHFSTPERLYGR